MRKVLFGLSLPLAASALETKPWLGSPYEFVWDTAFTYSRYRDVQNASVQLKNPSNDYDLLFDLGLTLSPSFDVQGELELAQTPRQSFNVRSGALQGRYLCLNDIAGDPLSLVFGLNVRGVPSDSLRDVSCPYAAHWNFEVTASAGKEWSSQGAWVMRTYGVAAIGIGNEGYPWTRELFVWQNNFENRHRLTLFALGDFGFGPKQHVNVRHFHGWGCFHHQSVDLGAGYGYRMSVYGTLSIEYAYRVFARDFPEHVNFLTIEYRIPFSVL